MNYLPRTHGVNPPPETTLAFGAWLQGIVSEVRPAGQTRHDYAPLAEKYLAGTATEAEKAEIELRWKRACERHVGVGY